MKKRKKYQEILSFYTCAPYMKFMMYGSWDIECDRQNFLSSRAIFCPFAPLTTRKIKILKKWEKVMETISFLHLCSTNDNHMMYGSWDMEWDRQNFLSFWTIFCPFIPLTTCSIKILKKWRKDWKISFYTCVP